MSKTRVKRRFLIRFFNRQTNESTEFVQREESEARARLAGWQMLRRQDPLRRPREWKIEHVEPMAD